MQESSDDQSNTPGWQYKPDDAPTDQSAQPKKAAKSVNWTASEFVDHQKTMGWYGLLALGGIGGATIIYLLTHDTMSTVMILIVMVILGIAAGRKPRTLEYELNTTGIHIGQRAYGYDDFKAFSVIDEGAISSIELLPLKRLMPSISIYYDPKDEANITAVLSAHLPFQEAQKDAFDRFVHRIRF